MAERVQIAVLVAGDRSSARGRIFHDKLGIFRDAEGDAVIFKGSMNETWAGLAADGNLESVDVAASWLGERDRERVETESRYFEELWADRYSGLLVRPFPTVARDELVLSAPSSWEAELAEMMEPPPASDPKGRRAYPHQERALADWELHGRRGILEFATGAGKTFTAIAAIRRALERDELVLVVVPDRVLFDQWFTELRASLPNVDILRAGAGHTRWRSTLRQWTAARRGRGLVLATLPTAATTDFLNLVPGATPSLLVVDEVHRAGSRVHRRILDESRFTGARLGMSATPQRAGDGEGTQALMVFFGRIVQPVYGLVDAIRDHVLCRYFYYAHTVSLTDAEAHEWADMSRQIVRLCATDPSPGPDAAERLRLLLIQRARIAKRASGKTALAVEVLMQRFERGQRWLVYCDDLRQLHDVSGALERVGITCMPFHSEMDGDRAQTLRWLDRRGGVVVAIRCLDEGVDVPSVTHALILASSRNPREFVQRRGRVLRRSPGKALAHVHDAIVVPPLDLLREGGDPITRGELARAMHFARHADNPAGAADLEQIAVDVGLPSLGLLEAGLEDDDDEDG